MAELVGNSFNLRCLHQRCPRSLLYADYTNMRSADVHGFLSAFFWGKSQRKINKVIFASIVIQLRDFYLHIVT